MREREKERKRKPRYGNEAKILGGGGGGGTIYFSWDLIRGRVEKEMYMCTYTIRDILPQKDFSRRNFE